MVQIQPAQPNKWVPVREGLDKYVRYKSFYAKRRGAGPRPFKGDDFMAMEDEDIKRKMKEFFVKHPEFPISPWADKPYNQETYDQFQRAVILWRRQAIDREQFRGKKILLFVKVASDIPSHSYPSLYDVLEEMVRTTAERTGIDLHVCAFDFNLELLTAEELLTQLKVLEKAVEEQIKLVNNLIERGAEEK